MVMCHSHSQKIDLALENELCVDITRTAADSLMHVGDILWYISTRQAYTIPTCIICTYLLLCAVTDSAMSHFCLFDLRVYNLIVAFPLSSCSLNQLRNWKTLALGVRSREV
jgi:hypothetical protein